MTPITKSGVNFCVIRLDVESLTENMHGVIAGHGRLTQATMISLL